MVTMLVNLGVIISGIAGAIYILDYFGRAGFLGPVKMRESDQPRKPSLLTIMVGVLLLTWSAALSEVQHESIVAALMYRLIIFVGFALVVVGFLIHRWAAIKCYPHWHAVFLGSCVAIVLLAPYLWDLDGLLRLSGLTIVLACCFDHLIRDSKKAQRGTVTTP